MTEEKVTRGASGEAWDELEDAYGDLRKGVSRAMDCMKEGSRS